MANVITIPNLVIIAIEQMYGIETSMPVANTELKKPSDIIKYITKVDEAKIYEAIRNSAASTTKLEELFRYCAGLTSLDLSSWTNISDQTSMKFMFHSCSSLQSIDFNNWDTSNITTMQGMFNSCSSLAKIWVPSTFVATQITTASYKPFYSTSGNTGGTHVYTDATDAATQGWGTIHSNYTMHYGATHADFENA